MEEAFIVFEVSDACPRPLAIPVSSLCRVAPLTRITKLPKAPGHVKGLVNSRGRILPVIDLRVLLNLPAPQAQGGSDGPSRLLIVEHGSEIGAFLAYRVSGPVEAKPQDITSTDGIEFNDLSLECVSGILKQNEKQIPILNVERILTGGGYNGKKSTDS